MGLLLFRVNNLSAASGDVLELMDAVPPLVGVARYGNVRKSNADLVLGIVKSMLNRIFTGLPNAVSGIDEESASTVLAHVANINDAVSLLQEPEITAAWQKALQILAASTQAAVIVSGYSTRLLADQRVLAADELTQVFHYRMSGTAEAAQSASWLEGFLKGSGSILLVDADLWSLVKDWVAGLALDSFEQVLPLLRRTFATYTSPEKRKLGEKVRSGSSGGTIMRVSEAGFDAERGRRGIPVVLKLFGIATTQNE